ncbi:MAG: RDD family protein, partial [Arenimonas sp.]
MNPEDEGATRPPADPAAPGWRLLSLLYDSLPMIPLLVAVSGLFLWLNGGHTIEDEPLLQLAACATSWLLVGAYFVLSWRRGGQTIGMRPWRLRV